MTTMTATAVKAICKETGGYNTMSLNEKLYLHFKGWHKIENLDEFTGARVVWLEGNGLQKIENLQPCSGLRQIYLQQNCIKEIENMHGFDELRALNLSENFIKKIENLGDLPCLETLQLNNNHITTLEDVEHLRECRAVQVLELSKCKIEDPAVIDVFEAMPNLKLLKLDGNPVIRKIPGYRKTLICRLKNLTYLDDRPVFEEERQTAEAWGRGGVEAERTERARQREFKKKKEENRHKSFLKMIEDAKRERRAEKKEQERIKAEQGGIVEDASISEREKAQEDLVDKLAKESKSTFAKSTFGSRKRSGGKRTKCKIAETDDGAVVEGMRRKCVIKEVSADKVQEEPSKAAWMEGNEGVVAAAVESGNKRKSKHRKDREARLRAAMAAVDAERGETSAPEAAPSVTAVPADDKQPELSEDKEGKQPEARFAHLSAQEIEDDLQKVSPNEAASTVNAAHLERSNVEGAPTLWGTKTYDELWEKASQVDPELCDDTAAEAVLEDDNTLVCDLEELD